MDSADESLCRLEGEADEKNVFLLHNLPEMCESLWQKLCRDSCTSLKNHKNNAHKLHVCKKIGK